MNPSDDDLRSLLTRARTIAVVGLSDKPERDSFQIAQYLQAQGYRIVPVNPAVAEVLGERAYPTLRQVPPDVRIDIADIFRRPDQVGPIVADALARPVGAIWMQTGIRNDEEAAKAEAKGVPVVQDLCLRVVHRRLGLPARPPER